jgi:hypothetical protein
MRHLPLPLLSLAIVAAACAPKKLPKPSPHDPAARESVLLTAHDLAPNRRCRIVDAAVVLPNVSTVLDTTAMPEFLHQAGLEAETGYALFSVRFDSTGKPIRARLIEATLADSLDDVVQQAVASALIDRGAGEPLAVRLRVDLAPVPRYRLGKSEYCDPEEIAQRGAPSPREVARPAGSVASRSTSTLKFDVDVSATGQVVGVHATSPIDDRMRTALFEERWKPAIDDGLPVPARATTTAWVERHLESRLEGRPAPSAGQPHP